MAVEDLVDEFWRNALRANPSGAQAQAKWITFIQELKDRVANFGNYILDKYGPA
jgi:hypothetical protein